MSIVIKVVEFITITKEKNRRKGILQQTIPGSGCLPPRTESPLGICRMVLQQPCVYWHKPKPQQEQNKQLT
jgi:hypothetical protein